MIGDDDDDFLRIRATDMGAALAQHDPMHEPAHDEPVFWVPLLGKAYTPPFHSTDDDGSPRLEVAILEPHTDTIGRRTERVVSDFATDCAATTTAAELLDALGPGRYRVSVRNRQGHLVDHRHLTLGRPVSGPKVRPMRGLGGPAPAEAAVSDRAERYRRELDETIEAHARAMKRQREQHEDEIQRLRGDVDRERRARHEAEDIAREAQIEAMEFRAKAMQAQAVGSNTVLEALSERLEKLEGQPADKKAESIEDFIRGSMQRTQAFADKVAMAGMLGGAMLGDG